MFCRRVLPRLVASLFGLACCPGLAGAQAAKKGPAAPAAHLPGLPFVEQSTFVGRALTVAVIILLSYLAYRVLLGSLRRLVVAAEQRSVGLPRAARQRQLRAVTVMSLGANILQWFISLLALIWVLSACGINLLPVLTGVGFLGAAVAFGAQSLVRDLVTGFFILLEGQYAVGDYVELNGKFGQVQTVGLRVTVLRDTRNQIHHVPNGTIATCTVYERHFVDMLLLVPLAKAEDAERACAFLGEATRATHEQLPRCLLRVGEPEALSDPTGFCVVKIPFSIFPTQDWVATSELPNRAKAVLAAHEIALPEGLLPQAVADLSDMPLPPADETAPLSAQEASDPLARWRRWVGAAT